MRLGARLPCNLLERFNYSQQEYYNMLSKVLFGNFLLSLFQLWFIYVNEGLILKFWILWTDLKDVFFLMPFCAIEPFWKGLTIHTLFMRSSRKKKIPRVWGGVFLAGRRGDLGLYCFLKIKVFSKKH